jgi:hypothetical protein
MLFIIKVTQLSDTKEIKIGGGGECQMANRLCFIAALTRRKETLEAGTN